MRQNAVIAAFNRGRVSELGVARVEDIKRIALSASIMVNYIARTLGAMMLRAGLQYLTPTRGNAQAIHIPFVFSTDDTALLELTTLVMRIRISDVLVSRVAVSSAVTNGEFTANVAGWTDADEAGATSAWATGGYLSLVGTGTNAAIRTQQVTVAAADRGIEHALRVVIFRGPVTLRVGSAAAGDQYINETTLNTGAHSLAFTPSGDFHIQLSNRRIPASLVDSCTVEAAGTVEIPTPWVLADLPLVRWDDSQSGDVVFVACKGYQQRRIERRAARSWSVALYQSEDGPFRTENVGPITLTPSALTGDITLTASSALFRSTQGPSTNSDGALFRLVSTGQTVTKSMGVVNDATASIRVTGVGADRTATIILASLSGTGDTVILERSFDDSTWTAVSGKSWTADTTEAYADGLDNQIVYYRLKCSVYAAGTVAATLTIPTGSIIGVAQITLFTSSVSVNARVLTALGATSATDQWSEGLWSDYRGWPSANALYEGRLWASGKDKITGSISDAFDKHDPEFEGDAGPINRSIGSGPVDDIAWILPLQRLIIGTEGSEVSCRSSALDEPLTPSVFNPKEATTQGSALVAAVKIDSSGVMVQRSGVRVYEISYDGSIDANDYSLRDLTLLCPEFGEPSITRLAVQRQPDTRIHCMRSDGTVGVIVIDKAEKVTCLLDVETDGLVEDIAILPSTIEDAVYYTVKRALASGDVRYLERFSLESECAGGTLNKQADSFIVYNGASVFTIPGLSHLEGEEVIAWGDGVDLSPDDEDGVQRTYTVTGGEIRLDVQVSQAVVGLPYRARWQIAKLGIGMATGTSLLQPKKIGHLGLMLRKTHAKGVKYGPDFDSLDPMPDIEAGKLVGANTVHETYDEPAFEFDGDWSTDSRLCLESKAPRPCTILAAVISVEGHGRD